MLVVVGGLVGYVGIQWLIGFSEEDDNLGDASGETINHKARWHV